MNTSYEDFSDCVIILPAVGVRMEKEKLGQLRPLVPADPLRLQQIWEAGLKAERGEPGPPLNMCELCRETGCDGLSANDCLDLRTICSLAFHERCGRKVGDALESMHLGLEIVDAPRFSPSHVVSCANAFCDLSVQLMIEHTAGYQQL